MKYSDQQRLQKIYENTDKLLRYINEKGVLSGRRGLVRQRITQENHAKRRRLPERQSPPLCVCEKTDVRELSVQPAEQTDDGPLRRNLQTAAQIVEFAQECFLRSG